MSKVLHAKKILNNHISQQRLSKQLRLPAERELAAQLGYSRATIGKALGALEVEGVVVRRKGSGTFISDMGKTRTMTIALVMRTTYHHTDMHFRLIIDEVSKYAEKNNIYIQIFDRLPDMFNDDPDNNPFISAVKNNIIDGVLVISRMPLSILGKISVICPTVSINNIFGDGSEIPCISCDYFRVGFLAGKYLFKNGHRKVAYVTENLSSPESTFDFSGFKAAFEMVGVDITEHDVLETKQNLNTFNKRVIDFFKDSNYTACFVRRTSYASKMISALQKSGIKTPDNLSVIATGNYNSTQSDMKLTIIDNKLDEMCHTGLHMIQDIVENNKKEGGLKLLVPEIIENDSVINLNQK